MTGGSAARRERVARAFHERSPLAGEPFVALDCARDVARLDELLHGWLLCPAPGEPARAPAGVYFLDSIGSLDAARQRQLQLVARRHGAGQEPGMPGGPLRLMAGDRSHLVRAMASGRLSDGLVDQLDKIRVELDTPARRGAA